MTDIHGSGRPLGGRRILVCGKGGSGKSTMVALMVVVLQRKAYEIVVLDGDASNPEGLIRLLFGLGVEGEPQPLIDFFGGIQRVVCPVDDPSPLTRVDNPDPVPERRIELFSEVPAEYYLRKDATTLLQAGKIENYGQGCDGPLEKVVRDFMITGSAVTLIDMKAGIEHFGRRIPVTSDVVLCVLDCTLESVSVAKRMAGFCREAGIGNFWLLLNKIGTPEEAGILLEGLAALRERVLGTIAYDRGLIRAGLSGGALGECQSFAAVEDVLERLEHEVHDNNEAGTSWTGKAGVTSLKPQRKGDRH